MIEDLTIIYLTANQMPERWERFQRKTLRKAIDGTVVISISRKPMDFGINLIDEEPKSYWNIYMQMLRGASMAETPYIGIAEDDVLYTKEHFVEFRPDKNKVAYDRSRWSLFTWAPMYSLRQRVSNCSLIAPRELLIEALTERKEKYPNGNEYAGEVGRSKVERRLGVTIRESIEWYCSNPIVHLNHIDGTDKGDYGIDKKGRHLIKKHAQIKAHDIPFWGKAIDIVRIYNDN